VVFVIKEEEEAASVEYIMFMNGCNVVFQNFDVHGREVILPPGIYDLVRYLSYLSCEPCISIIKQVISLLV